MRASAIVVVAFAAALATPAAAQRAKPCGPVDHAAAIHAKWLKKESAPSPGASLGMDEAVCHQRRLVELQSKSEGARIGYKVGLTSPAAQQQFGVSTPVVGVLTKKMILADGARVPVIYGARPVVEADMLVTVGDAKINDVRTPLEVARHLRSWQPFIELPDLVIAEGQPLTGAVIVAINVGARRGVAGKPIAMRKDQASVDAFGSMQVSLVDDQGRELAKAPGAAILGHPLNAVVVLADELKRRGTRLKPGDVISLGSFGRPTQPLRGRGFTANYDGAPGGKASVTVWFR
jgi:2-keto-4-pentenoate hydratase